MKRLDVSQWWCLDNSAAIANQSKEIIPDNNKFCRNFLDLLKKIFVYDPNERITAKQALQHPWFKEAALPDDGTEAAKIRVQRQIQAEEAAAAAAVAAPKYNGYRH
jgi:dual-specificity kinase